MQAIKFLYCIQTSNSYPVCVPIQYLLNKYVTLKVIPGSHKLTAHVLILIEVYTRSC